MRSFNLTYSLSISQIQTICDQIASSGKVAKIYPMTEGLSAYLVKIEFSDPNQKPWVIRVINPDKEMKYEREIGSMLKAQNLKVSTPNILLKDNSCSIIPEPYYIYEYLDGTTLGTGVHLLNLNQKEQIYAELGQMLAKMHLDTQSCTGGIFFLENQLQFVPFEMNISLEEQMFQGQLEDFNWAIEHAFREKYDHLIAGCIQIWEKSKNSLRNFTSPIGFTHNDLLADNIIIKSGHIQAMIDWESGSYGDILYDLARSERGIFQRTVMLTDEERSHLQEVFLSNYQKIRPIEDAYWNKRKAHFIVMAMDDLSGLPDYQKRLPAEYCQKIEQNLIHEIEIYIETFKKSN